MANAVSQRAALGFQHPSRAGPAPCARAPLPSSAHPGPSWPAPSRGTPLSSAPPATDRSLRRQACRPTRLAPRAARSGDEDPAVWSPAADDDFGGMDWRTFRAKLVAQSQALRSVSGASQSQQASVGLEIWQDRMSLDNWAMLASQNPALAREVPWVHHTAGPEVGGVLLASPQMNRSIDERYWQVVVLITRHDARGSTGLILNRPSGYTLKKAMTQTDGVDGALSVFAGNAIYVGGYRSDGRTLHFLHGHPLPGAVELAPGVYFGGLEEAAEKVLEGSLPPTDFRFFVGSVEWLPGKLEEEMSRGAWYTAASARSLVLKQCLQLPKPLWQEMLELMGGDFAEAAKREYGEIP